MKKLVSLWITILMVGLMTATSWAATGEIAVTQVLGSSNTAPTGPVGFLVDGNPGTAWVTSQETPGPAWAVLQLKETARVDGLQLYGPCYGKLTVEYWQDNGWHSFLAAADLAGENFSPGWNLVDLSYDRIVTDKIRLSLTSDQGMKLGGIGEIKVLGQNGSQSLERLEPAVVTYGGASEIEHPVGYLFDHNTYSFWRPLTSLFFNNPAVIDLGESCSIERIKIFGSSEAGKGKAKDNSFKLQYLSNANWLDIPGMTNLSVTEIGAGWKSYNLAAPIAASKIRIVIGSNPKEGGIREIEIWGKRSLPSGSRYLESNRGPVPLRADTAANYSFTIDSAVSGPVFLQVVTEGAGAAPLTWELNGQSMGNLTNASAVRGFTVYRQGINPNALWQGANFIRIKGADITVRDCKLEMAAESGLDFSGSPLTDRWKLTAPGGGEHLIDLGGGYHLDELLLSYLGNNPQVQVAVYQNGAWITLSPSSSSGNVVGGELIYSGIGVAGQIKICSGAIDGGPAELSIHGSYINGGAPQITFSSPQDGACLGLSQWLGATLQGSIDNPDAALTINGIKVPTNGTGFKVLLSLLGLKSNEDNVIQATAVDSSGRTGTARITVRIGTLPEFTVNLGSGITYTTAASITVSGKTSILTGKVFINGAEVKLNNFSFSQAVALQEGLNLITVKVSLLGSNIYNLKQFKVVRNSSVPTLKVLSPADGQVVNASQITVSGVASSLTPVTVSVNGKAATVDSGSFTSSPVSLAEGSNKLTVIARDQNGLTSQAVLSIRRDSAKPALSGITPAEGAYLNALTVKVSGTVSDASPVAVLVNGVAATVSVSDSDSDQQFSATVTVSEGANTLNIQATDSAGNSATATRNVLVDTGAPAAFIPAANISGWSNNNKPTITFSATDSGSGIDHYEIGVDGVTSSSRAVSPYTFTTAIAEGEHTVQVKAVDRAGNYTIGEVKVFIDTVAPITPANFEAIPGIGRVILNWEDNGGEVQGYRITRTPAFSGGGSYREVFRANEETEVAQYADSDVATGGSYSYTVQAIDRAGNYSAATAKLTAGVGQATQAVNNQGGTVKFDNCSLTIPAGAVTASGQIVMKKTEEALPANVYGIKLGTAYSFALLDFSGIEVETKFDSLVTLTVSYADMTLPEGFDEGDLGIYWYNKAGGYWEKLDYGFNDIEGKTITVKLKHFSDYQVMASKYNSPSLDSYYNMGIAPYQSYFQNNTENVSPASGSLAISATDLKLPGRGGFDLVIKRIYDSASANQERLMASNKDQSYSTKAPVDTFGCGWSLGIPWIETCDKGKYIKLSEGQTIKIEFDSSSSFEYHAGVHFILKKNSSTDGYSLTFNNGNKCEFDSSGRVLTQTDPSGINVITFTYSTSNSRQISKITDSIGRVVNFHYTTAGGKGVIDSITTGVAAENVREVTYAYNNGDDALTDVYDSMERHMVYGYEAHTLQSGLHTEHSRGSDNNKIFSYTVDLLNSITYPTGEKSLYTYDLMSQYHHEEHTRRFLGIRISKTYNTYVGTRILVSKHLLAGKETDYIYTMNSDSGSCREGSFIPAYTYMYSCRTTEGQKISQIKFQQIKNDSLVDVPEKIDNYKGQLPINSVTTIGDNKEVETVTYEYNVQLRAVTSEKHYRGGNLAYSLAGSYDSWGNLTYQYDSSRNLEQDWTYYKQESLTIKNLVETQKQINKNPIKNTTSTVTITYTYDDTLGKPLTTMVSDASKDRVSRFTYDSKGNLKAKIEEFKDNLKTESFYDDTYQAFPVKQIIYGVVDADGNMQDITTQTVYNYETGLKMSETDARGFITRYEYDKLDRIIKVILPDDDGDDSNNPYREFYFDDTKNTCVYRDAKGQTATYSFDGLGRLTSILKNSVVYSGGLKTSYHYNTLGQIDQVMDALSRITSYAYDGLNRVTKVTYPDGNFVSLGYDNATNTVTITDEKGGVVIEQNDWANRLILAKQYCAYNGATDVYTWQFVYDSLGNKLRKIDPKSNRTDREYDSLGQLTSVLMPSVPVVLPGGSATTDYQPKISYEYNEAGLRTAETSANENAKESGNKIHYDYDQLGRVIKVTAQAIDIFTNNPVSIMSKIYYDAAGNKVKVVDPNGGISESTYSAQGYLLTQSDPAGNVTRYQYDVLGNKIAVTDPRGSGTDGAFTTQYQYDDLNRLVKIIMPDQTFTEITYDKAGNKLAEKDPNGVVTSYTYTARNWVETVSQNGELKIRYVYDAKGNQIEVHDALDHITTKEYDSLDRVQKISQQGTSTIKVEYTYDALGNKVAVKDGRDNTTTNTYNGLGWLTSVRDPLLNLTQYFYDPNGNQVKTITAKGLTLQNHYDELNRLTESIDSLKHSTQYSYDAVGNLQRTVDRRGTTWIYQYTPNYLLKQLDLSGADGKNYYVEYTYDAVGNREQVRDSGNKVQYNLVDGVYQADAMNRLNSVDRNFDGSTYRIAYQYDNAGLLTRIKYPEATDWLQYNYNDLNQLNEVKGFANSITYNANGALTDLTYANGAVVSYNYDTNNRLKDYQVTVNGTSILQQQYTYDNNNNITAITEGSAIKTFEYDVNNQLTRSITPGKFLENDTTPGTYGIKTGDYLGAKMMDFSPVLIAMMGLDYNSSSIGIDFGTTASGVKKIQIIPDGKFTVHRVTQRTLDLYTSADNSTYTIIPRTSWTFATDSKGVITITLKERVAARYLKVHVKFDERDSYFNAKSKATFLNDFAKMLRIYQEATSRTEEFQYDADGNRTYQRVTLIQSNSYSSSYYANSDRLKTDGKYAFVYDEAGNLVKKGNTFKISGDTVTFTANSGEGVEYWQYTYDLMNRLIEVSKNGTVVADYEYSPDGLREVKRAKGVTTHYVFEGTEPIFEKRITDGRIRSYVYALGKHLARVDGVIGDTTAKVYYYHTDHLESVRAVTDSGGNMVWKADYFAFGTQFSKNKVDTRFEEDDVAFAGKGYDGDTGLYYFNARWYDSETGRFTSEDPMGALSYPNLHSYCGNNPVIYVDPSGKIYILAAALVGGVYGLASTAISDALSGKKPQLDNYISGFVGGALGGAYASVTGDMLGASILTAGTTNLLKNTFYAFEGKPVDPYVQQLFNIAYDAAIGYEGAKWGEHVFPRPWGNEPIYFGSSLTGKIGRNVLWGQGAISATQGIGSGVLWNSMTTNDFPDYPNNSQTSNYSQSSSSSGDSFSYSNGMDSISIALGNNSSGPIGDVLNTVERGVYTGPQPYSDYSDSYIDANTESIATSYQYQNGWVTEYSKSYYVDENGRTVTYDDPHTVWEPNDDGNNGSGTTEPSHSIICTELHRQGLMPDDIYRADEAFGKLLRGKCPLILKGYYFWARPVVQHMRKSKLFTKIVHMIAKPWYLEMAHIIDKKHKGSFAGEILMIIGIPLCWLIGLVISNKLLVVILLISCVVLWLMKKCKVQYFREKIS